MASVAPIGWAGVVHPLPTDYDGEKIFVRGQSVNNSGGDDLGT
jgi:hypothetical protein